MSNYTIHRSQQWHLAGFLPFLVAFIKLIKIILAFLPVLPGINRLTYLIHISSLYSASTCFNEAGGFVSLFKILNIDLSSPYSVPYS